MGDDDDKVCKHCGTDLTFDDEEDEEEHECEDG